MWTFKVKDGILSHNGVNVGMGYSGHAQGLNNPAFESVPDVGPIPVGTWSIGEWFDDPGGKGPIVCRLEPAAGTAIFGRSGFMIHGDNSEMDHSASLGCLILSRDLRLAMRESGDVVLQVE